MGLESRSDDFFVPLRQDPLLQVFETKKLGLRQKFIISHVVEALLPRPELRIYAGSFDVGEQYWPDLRVRIDGERAVGQQIDSSPITAKQSAEVRNAHKVGFSDAIFATV